MKYFSILYVCIAITCTELPTNAQSTSDKIDEVMQLYHQYGLFAGTVLVAEKGKPIYQQAFGLADLEFDVSLTKSFFGSASLGRNRWLFTKQSSTLL
ncbi:MAG: hypothetical protein AAGG75_04080 [Bacteroidota bacterium]